MSNQACNADERKMKSGFERYLTVWVGLCIVAGILLGKLAPGLAKALDGLSISVNGAPVVSIPIAICLFFMMYPIIGAAVLILYQNRWLVGVPCTSNFIQFYSV